MKIAVIGMGYVGLSLAALLAQKHEVWAVDILPEKIHKINQKICPVQDKEIQHFFDCKTLNLHATTDYVTAVQEAQFAIVATPTDYDEKANCFDTSQVFAAVQKIKAINPATCIILRSTVPVGYTKWLQTVFAPQLIFFSPEFLREGFALYDNLYPSRIIIGDNHPIARQFTSLLAECAYKQNIPTLFTSSQEAEAIKLFSNAFLAMRISFFNEVDTYAQELNISTKKIIEGISLDPRIGTYYNNPSFGYGGYCLPKDTKQLLADFRYVPQKIIGAVIQSNQTRKQYILQTILKKQPETVGVYRLLNKSGSDNCRFCAVQEIIEGLIENHIKVIIYEPTLKQISCANAKLENDLDNFKQQSQLIIANRLNTQLDDVMDKVYSRDLFYTN